MRIPHSSAIVKGIAEGTIEWETDPDFGYKVAAHVPGIEAADMHILQPRLLYDEQGRADEYARWVARLKARARRVPVQVPEPRRANRGVGRLERRAMADDVPVKLAVQRTARGLEAAVNAHEPDSTAAASRPTSPSATTSCGRCSPAPTAPS